MLEIGTCKLDLRGGRTHYLHDVLYALEVRWNIVFVLALLQLDFNIAFVDYCVKIYLDNIFYNSGFVSNGFIVLDIVNVSVNYDASIYVVQNSSTTNDSSIITWNARLGHIEQDRLYRLAKISLLGSHCPFMSIALLEKQLNYYLAKVKELVVHHSLFIQTFVAQ